MLLGLLAFNCCTSLDSCRSSPVGGAVGIAPADVLEGGSIRDSAVCGLGLLST